MKHIIIPLLLGLGLGLAILIAPRMSTDAGAVIIGVVVGFVASVPTSLLLVALPRRAPRNNAPITTYQPTTPPSEEVLQ